MELGIFVWMNRAKGDPAMPAVVLEKATRGALLEMYLPMQTRLRAFNVHFESAPRLTGPRICSGCFSRGPALIWRYPRKRHRSIPGCWASARKGTRLLSRPLRAKPQTLEALEAVEAGTKIESPFPQFDAHLTRNRAKKNLEVLNQLPEKYPARYFALLGRLFR